MLQCFWEIKIEIAHICPNLNKVINTWRVIFIWCCRIKNWYTKHWWRFLHMNSNQIQDRMIVFWLYYTQSIHFTLFFQHGLRRTVHINHKIIPRTSTSVYESKGNMLHDNPKVISCDFVFYIYALDPGMSYASMCKCAHLGRSMKVCEDLYELRLLYVRINANKCK